VLPVQQLFKLKFNALFSSSSDDEFPVPSFQTKKPKATPSFVCAEASGLTIPPQGLEFLAPVLPAPTPAMTKAGKIVH